jgi:hypothetical protein
MPSESSVQKNRTVSALGKRIESPRQLGKEEKRAANF